LDQAVENFIAALPHQKPYRQLVARSSELIEYLPPDQLQTFIQQGLRPLAMGPPFRAELRFVTGSRY
jgi:hypothetical protein